MTDGMYEGRQFRCISNCDIGQSGDKTIFCYRQQGGMVWATYHGGEVRRGVLVAKVADDDCLEMRYQHVDTSGKFRSGQCTSTPQWRADGMLQMNEVWEWDTGGRGMSTLLEVR